jgi:hypothetical protein
MEEGMCITWTCNMSQAIAYPPSDRGDASPIVQREDRGDGVAQTEDIDIWLSSTDDGDEQLELDFVTGVSEKGPFHHLAVALLVSGVNGVVVKVVP